ncbi:MAG: TIGR00730 family Rossman fold protein [Verrucomicrobia bacterium]|nr:TIGR00730 family Rossman fold protein [Verrucomicrobiota bacterium]
MFNSICVFCSSSGAVAANFFEATRELGALIGQRRMTLVYGGGNIGLMGVLAKSVHKHGGRVVGVIPQFMRDKGLAYDAADELIVPRDLRARKAIMEERAEAFCALPGGLGTLEEILEMLTLKQLEQHTKPIVFVNTDGFFDPLLHLFDQFYEQRFAKPESRRHFHVAAQPQEVFAHLDCYQPPRTTGKWFPRVPAA